VRRSALAALSALLVSASGIAAALPGRAAEASNATANATASGLVTRLQQALNAPEQNGLDALLAPDQQELIGRRFRRFAADFPDARWSLKAGQPMADGRQTLALAVSASRELDGQRFTLQASQQLALTVAGGRITGQEVLQEESVLSSASQPFPVSLLIPDAVLTGSRYDVDVVLEQPLGDAMLAGGLIGLTPEQVAAQQSPDIQLEPLGGGGLFKSVKAPYQPGSQTWAALVVHPEGVITVTKRVRVVSDKSQLRL
jgi:hypothetical protein